MGQDQHQMETPSPPSEHNEIPLIEYLFQRLCQLGVCSIHGVPGDNDNDLMGFDHIERCGMHWVRMTDELNAGFAADGYARINGISALMTVFGAGKSLAETAIKGSYTKNIPVVNIVSVPSTELQHLPPSSLKDGDFHKSANLYESQTRAQVFLNADNLPNATRMIDETLRQCVQWSLPVSIALSADVIKANVLVLGLRQAVQLSTLEDILRSVDFPISEDQLRTSKFIEEMLALGETKTAHDIAMLINNAKQPIIVVDSFASKYKISEQVDKFVGTTEIPTFTTSAGRGIINETYKNFCGIFPGLAGFSDKDTPDLVIHIAPSKGNSDPWSICALVKKPEITIEIGHRTIAIFGKEVVGSYNVINVLGKVLSYHPRGKTGWLSQCLERHAPSIKMQDKKPTPPEDALLNQNNFYANVSEFYQPGDVIMTDRAATVSGGLEFILPPQATMIDSGEWLSVRHMLSASVGVALSQKDLKAEPSSTLTTDLRLKGRTILFESDDTFQMTAQTVTDIIRNRLDMIIFFIYKDGYATEPSINGMHADVQPSDYVESAGDSRALIDEVDYPIFMKRVTTWGELVRLMEEPQLKSGKGLNMVEVMMMPVEGPSKTLAP